MKATKEQIEELARQLRSKMDKEEAWRFSEDIINFFGKIDYFTVLCELERQLNTEGKTIDIAYFITDYKEI